jgi:carboxylesterase type B
MGTPVICVGIQYRLGWLGFLASNDFEEETEHYENGLGPGNWGIIDQRNAFLWIKKNISAFGGDPNNVTAFGTLPPSLPQSLSNTILSSLQSHEKVSFSHF